MVIDTSALLAIFLAEPERQNLLELIRLDGVRLISAQMLWRPPLCWKLAVG